jgi:arginine decarboxylase
MSAQNRIDTFFAMHSARSDRWRDALTAAQKWTSGKGTRAEVDGSLADLNTIEEFHAYPGTRLMGQLRDKIAAGDAATVVQLIRKFSDTILTGAYRHQAESGEATDDGDVLQEVLPAALTGREARRPYFEVLFVSPQPASRWPAICQEVRRLRRHEDSFIYEPVIVGSFEDALCAAIVNPKILAVIVAEGVPFRSTHDAPALRRVLDSTLEQVSSDSSTLKLASMLKGIRPDLDIYVTTDRDVEKLASDPAAASARRIFYAVEELLELHLSILEGIQARYETPFFDNLKRYAQRPIGTFHALPIARGKSVFKSEWIRDMGEFYGINLFLAESSATTGGLDSLLEPTGNIKKAQEMAMSSSSLTAHPPATRWWCRHWSRRVTS